MNCPTLRLEDGAGLARTLRVIDCRTGEAAAGAFDRLFGSHGALLPALTLLLTLYVAFFAIQLLTGRARLGVAALTPRMLTIGLALTFATSWIAYQQVVWNLATGAPDQIATILAGTDGSATTVFADRVDRIVTAIADAADGQQAVAPAATGAPAGGAAAPVAAPSADLFSPKNLLWGSGLLLLIGTVGVLVTAKVVLAALLALGPVFIVMALFQGTRGLFEGWLKATVSAAIAPMFATVIGGGTLAMLTPLIRNTLMTGGDAAIKSAVTLFLATFVYCALMVMCLRTARTIVSGWRLPGSRDPRSDGVGAGGNASVATATASASAASAAPMDERVRAMIAAMPVANDRGGGAAGGQPATAIDRRVVAEVAAAVSRPVTQDGADQRLRGTTRPFRSHPTPGPIRPRSQP